MNALIIEDEQLAIERLTLLLRQYDPSITIVGALGTVRDTVAYLKVNARVPDFLLVDVQLADGPAFDIFQQVQPDIPVVFTTAYDRYALEAFQLLSIDYLLKPVTLGDLARAIGKIKLLRYPNPHRDNGLPSPATPPQATPLPGSRYKSRFLCRTGQRLQVVSTTEVAVFSADGHAVRLITRDNTKYLVDHTLEELERLLDPAHFFRANRNTILHALGIGAVKPFVNNRLRVSLKTGDPADDIIISRERVADFKKWADS